MLRPESIEATSNYIVSIHSSDKLDMSNVFFRAAADIGFIIKFEAVTKKEMKLVRVLTLTQGDADELKGLENSFQNTPIGTMINFISSGQFIPLLTEHLDVLSGNHVRFLAKVPVEERHRAFLNAFDRDQESGESEASEFRNKEMILSQARIAYAKFRTQGLDPFSQQEIDSMALTQLSDVMNLLRVNPY